MMHCRMVCTTSVGLRGRIYPIERRFGAGNVERLKKAAAELVELKVDIITHKDNEAAN